MQCQSLFSGNNKKNISKACLLNFLPSMQSVNELRCPNIWGEYGISCIDSDEVDIQNIITIITLSIGTGRSEQTVQTQIRCCSDQGLLCLPLKSNIFNLSLRNKLDLRNFRTSILRK